MNRTITSSFLFIALVLLAVGCDKDNGPALVSREAGTIGAWTTEFKALDRDDNKVLAVSEYQAVDLATYTFEKTGKGTVVGVVEGQQVAYDFRWRLVPNVSAIIFTTPTRSDSITVDRLDADKMVFRYTNRDTVRWLGFRK